MRHGLQLPFMLLDEGVAVRLVNALGLLQALAQKQRSEAYGFDRFCKAFWKLRRAALM